jgi:hypothetical protein
VTWLASFQQQVCEVSCGNNYLSQNPTDLHIGFFGSLVDVVRVDWPNGTQSWLHNVEGGQRLVLEQPPDPRRYSGGIRVTGISPNPSPAPVWIGYDGTGDSVAFAEIYDVAGRLIRRLHANGDFQIQWDGRDSRDLPAPAGVYFIRVDDGISFDSGRIVLLR